MIAYSCVWSRNSSFPRQTAGWSSRVGEKDVYILEDGKAEMTTQAVDIKIWRVETGVGNRWTLIENTRSCA